MAVLEAAAGGTQRVGGVALVAGPGPERRELGWWWWLRSGGGEVGRVGGEGGCQEGRWGGRGEMRHRQEGGGRVGGDLEGRGVLGGEGTHRHSRLVNVR